MKMPFEVPFEPACPEFWIEASGAPDGSIEINLLFQGPKNNSKKVLGVAKFASLEETILWIKKSTGDSGLFEHDNNK